MKCDHRNFETESNMVRLADFDGGPVRHFMAEIKIKCTDCGLPFRFNSTGLNVGVNINKPSVSPDALQLRIPMKPSDQEIPKEAPSKIKRPSLIVAPPGGKFSK